MAGALPDPHSEDGGRSAQAHRPKTGAVERYEEVLLHLPQCRVRVLLVQRREESLLRHLHAPVGGSADANANYGRRAGTAAGVQDGVDDEPPDALDAVGGVEHCEARHVLRSGALGQDRDLGEVVIGRDVVDEGHALSEVVAVVLPGDRVDGVRPERDLLRRPRHPVGDALRDGRVEPPPDVEHGDPRVLAHGESEMLGLLHVLHDRSELGVRDLAGLPSRGGLQGPADVGRELGVGQTQEVDYYVLDGFGELDHGHCDVTVAWIFGCLERVQYLR